MRGMKLLILAFMFGFVTFAVMDILAVWAPLGIGAGVIVAGTFLYAAGS